MKLSALIQGPKVVFVFLALLTCVVARTSAAGSDFETSRPSLPASLTAIEVIAPEEGDGGVDASSPAACSGDIIAQSRVDALIAALCAESLDESFLNLSRGDDYDYPGFYKYSDPRYLFVDREHIFSNRRFARVYEGLRALNSDAQYVLLKGYLDHYRAQLSDIIAPFMLSSRRGERPESHDVLIRITEVEGCPPTFYGTRYALQSIALLSGMLGNTRMWPDLREAFQYPLYAMPLDESAYDDLTIAHFKDCPIFPPAIQADTILLMAINCPKDESGDSGFNAALIKPLVTERDVFEFELANFQSRVSEYDVHHNVGGWPVDRTKGMYRVRVVYDGKRLQETIKRIVDAAVGAPVA